MTLKSIRRAMGAVTPQQKKTALRALRLALSLSIALLICEIPLNFLEYYTYDIRARFNPPTQPSGWIETIAIDQNTVESLQRDPNAEDHALMLKRILAAKPKAVVYVMSPTEITGSFEELAGFAKSAQTFDQFFVVTDELFIAGQEAKMQLPAPLDSLLLLSGPKTADTRIFAKDGVTRRIVYSYQDRITFHPMLARTLNHLGPDEIQGKFPFLESEQMYIDFRPEGTYIPTGFIDVLENRFDKSRFENKIVLIGRDIRTNPKDYVMTPYSRSPTAMTTLEVHANMLDTLILNTAPIPASRWVDFLLTAIISAITVYVVLSVRPARGLAVLGLTLISFVILSYLLFVTFHYAVEMVHPVLAIFVCYYFFIPYRLIMENRKSWEYYQRNKLLLQVEELKSNFLKLMSHDLKTPLARIQGMADMVLTESQGLNEKHRGALDSIHKSSDELTHFISSILNLSRIESKEIKLQLKSRDINSLIDQVAHKLEPLAKEKGIEIKCEFEPLFSVKMDEDLLRQVFSNLIENAIKYSPNGSKILISTEEVDGKVIVQVADQGYGIHESEIEHIFSKFYRSKEAQASPVRGTGLGLYLAKYFVTLHQGRISCESTLKQGSTFTVELPMEPEAVPQAGIGLFEERELS